MQVLLVSVAVMMTGVLIVLGRLFHDSRGAIKDQMGPTAYKAWRRDGIHVAANGDYRTLTRAIAFVTQS